ncbi:copper transporter [Plantactinospora solaniradicis]|uniref:Copper transporter n=1 Tax=Plantactinospora solaniradicis TaxID=1723736 RepID=A0ABW1K6Z5_9ACTN
MINFRYHMVSLAAVFLALAVGAVFGTTAANGVASDVLSESVNAAHKANKQLRETANEFQEEASRKDDYINETAPALLSGTLTGRRIVVLTTPSGREHAEGVIEKLGLAGAAVTGPVDVREAFFNPKNNLDLLALTRTVSTGTLPANGDGVETACALLATVLLTPDPSGALAGDRRSVVLSAYAKAQYLTAPERLDGPGDAAVLVTGPAYVDEGSAERNAAIVTMAAQFGATGRTVVAGTGAGEGSIIGAVRGDDALAARISTVDGVAGVQGEVVTALALAERIVADRVGRYGTAAGADALTPRRR